MLDYRMDLLPGSYHYTPTPDVSAQSFPFYCTESGRLINGDAYYTKRDKFSHYLLIATDGGAGKMSWNGQNCLLQKGSAVLIDCNTYQEYAALPGDPWSFFYLHFNALSMEGYRNMLLSRLVSVKLRSPEYVWQLIQQIYQMSHRSDMLSYASQSHIISGLLTELLCSLASDHTASSKLCRQDVNALAEYIRSNYTAPLCLEDFSEFLHLSRHHLIRIFERQTGMSPYKYLHMCRVNRAQQLLTSSDMPVSQIAYAVGYNDPIVLTRHFQSFHKISPAQYRKEFIMLPSADSRTDPEP